ncbi:MAG: helix-hairpin-helix domain-containing protein [Pseudomonadales bacterium]
MKAHKLFISFFAVLVFCYGNLVLADNTESGDMATAMTVNINEADAEALAEVLDGIGPNRAQAIIIYRDEHGRFYTPEELSAVRGIGAATIKKNEGRIAVE